MDERQMFPRQTRRMLFMGDFDTLAGKNVKDHQ